MSGDFASQSLEGTVIPSAPAELTLRLVGSICGFADYGSKGGLMQRDPPPKRQRPSPQPASPAPCLPSFPDDPLTPAQREFARVLGQLLADLWEQEQQKQKDTASVVQKPAK